MSGVKGLTWPIYAMSVATLMMILLGTYTVREDRQHAHDLARADIERQEDVNTFLQLVCDRFELRDEITIAILRREQELARSRGDMGTVSEMDFYIAAFTDAQGTCIEDVPPVRPLPEK